MSQLSYFIFFNILIIITSFIKNKLQLRNTLLLSSPLPDLSQSAFPKIPNGKEFYEYDLVVLGSGPGGEAAAVMAAKTGAKVAVVEKRSQV